MSSSPNNASVDPAMPRVAAQPAAAKPGEGTYGYGVPASNRTDPSRGHEMERNALPADADFSLQIETDPPVEPSLATDRQVNPAATDTVVNAAAMPVPATPPRTRAGNSSEGRS